MPATNVAGILLTTPANIKTFYTDSSWRGYCRDTSRIRPPPTSLAARSTTHDNRQSTRSLIGGDEFNERQRAPAVATLAVGVEPVALICWELVNANQKIGGPI